jgi:serine/threonine protein kinase
VLANIEKLLNKILLFVREPRFLKDAWYTQLLKCRFAFEDASALKDFSEKLTCLAGDLGVVLLLRAPVELQAIKDSRTSSIIEAVGVLSKGYFLEFAKPNMKAIKAELDRGIETSIRLVSVMADATKPLPGLLSSHGKQRSSGKVVPTDSDLDRDEMSSHGKQRSSGKVVPTDSDLDRDVNRRAGPTCAEVELSPVQMTRLEYSLETSRRLGQGSFGDVYECVYKNKPAALKHLPRTLDRVTDRKLLKSLKKEALIMQVVSHPNIIGFLGASIEKHILILDLACGSLDDVLYNASWASNIQVKPFVVMPPIRTMEWKFRVINDVASALRYLLVNNIIHRGIKPGKVLLVLLEGSRLAAKVCDFGISQAVEIAASSVGTKANHKAVGTSHYMAPEVFNSEFMRYEASTDMYSFGVLAAELFVEGRPWGNMPQGANAHAVVNDHKGPLVVKWQPSDGKEHRLHDLVGNSDSGCFAKTCRRDLAQPHS